MLTAATQRTYPYGDTNWWLNYVYVFSGMVQFLPTILLLIATTGFYGCSKVSECEVFMAKQLSSHPYEFTSGGCIDVKHAYLYSFDNPHVLVFASVSKDTFIVDSVIDFNHSFAKYANMEELEQAIYEADDKILNQLLRGEEYAKDAKYKLPTHNIAWPVIYRRKERYQLVSHTGIYEISFRDKQFTQTIEFDEIKSTFQSIICNDSISKIYYERKLHTFQEYDRKKHFFPEYTKITLDNSYLILYENGDIVANAEAGYCLYVKKMNPKEEIIVFGSDCNIEENCKP